MIKVAQKTVVTPQVPRKVQMIHTMTHSKVQIMVDARPRGDSSAVSRFNVADIDQSSLRKRKGA